MILLIQDSLARTIEKTRLIVVLVLLVLHHLFDTGWGPCWTVIHLNIIRRCSGGYH